MDEFVKIRFDSLEKLSALNITDEQLSNTAIHPELGSVTLSQLISTWVVHDLDHTVNFSNWSILANTLLGLILLFLHTLIGVESI